ncbi:MAG: hypothetical protein WBL45_01070 [Solirubrobacterales bacterium]
MIGRRAVIGPSLLSALLVCAFAAQSAPAIVTTHSLNTTMVTCQKIGAGNEFGDAHCDNKVSGEYAHVAVEKGKTTKISATNANLTGGTKDTEPAIFKFTIGLAKATIECLKVESNAATSSLTNTEPAAGQHTFSGTVEIAISECNVKELKKCIVAEPIGWDANVTGVEGMEGPKGEKNAMGIQFVGAGAEESFGTIEFTNKGAEACSLNGKSFPVKGKMVATGGPTTESAQENKGPGATLVFTPKLKMQTLLFFGPNAATFETIITPTNSTSKTPISMTTST